MTRFNPADRIINRIGLDGGLQTSSNLYRVSDIETKDGTLDIQIQCDFVSITDDLNLYDEVTSLLTSDKYTNSFDVDIVDIVATNKHSITFRLYLTA